MCQEVQRRQSATELGRLWPAYCDLDHEAPLMSSSSPRNSLTVQLQSPTRIRFEFHNQGRHMMRISVLAAVLLVTGCASLTSSPMVINQLKIRTAGFTGCAVDANVITNVTGNADGSGTWNATCKDKVYLCSQGSSVAPTYSCAVAVN
jgi:hypothetical protein